MSQTLTGQSPTQAFTLDPEMKAKWIEELHSGRWTQCTNRLREAERGRCATGVLCEAIGRPVLSGRSKDAYDLLDRILPRPIFSAINYMNDCGASFEQIADYIETNL